MPSNPAKGKGKAQSPSTSTTSRDPDERTAFLPTSSPPTQPPIFRPRSSLRYRITTCLVILLSVLLAGVLFLSLLLYSYKPSTSEIAALPKTAFRYTLPEDVHVLDVGEAGVRLKVIVRCGIDYDRVMGISRADMAGTEREDAEMRGDRGFSAGWWEALRRWTAHEGLRVTNIKSVEVEIPREIMIYRTGDKTKALLSVKLYEPVQLPLIPNLPLQTAGEKNADGLLPVSFEVLAKPIASTGELWELVQHAWASGEFKVSVEVWKVLGRVPGLPLGGDVSAYNLAMDISVPIPELPGLPKPGKPLDLASLVHLDSYSFQNPSPESRNDTLYITALASLPNPLQNASTNASLPFGLPFAISLQDGTPMAKVVTLPLDIGHSASINMTIAGQVSSHLGSGENGEAKTGLSEFLQNYLHGIDNPITVTGLSKLPSFASNNPPFAPDWLLSTLPSLSLPLSFPAPQPPPKIIQEVTIEHMRLSESGGKMRASGVVVVIISLPPGLEGMNINVKEIQPDILVYDGPASSEPPDPADPPQKAFGHINPEEYIESTTIPSPLPGEPSRMIVRAPLKDVEVVILKGRDGVLSDFVGKIVFKGGALAGIKGTANVKVEIGGTEGMIGLNGLPVEGEVWVGKQRLSPELISLHEVGGESEL